MNETRRITEGALMTGIYLLLLLVIIFTPSIIGGLLLLTLPVPFVFYSYRHGWKAGGMMLIATLIFTVIFATAISLPATLFAGIGGVFLGGALYNKRTAYETLAVGSLGFSLGFLGIYLTTQAFFGLNWTEEIRNSLDQAFTLSQNMFGSLLTGDANQEQIDAIREQISTLPDLIPSILVLSGIMIAFIAQWLAYRLINRVERKQHRFPPFQDFKLPTSILWYYFFAMIFTYLVGDQDGTLYLATINVYTLTGVFLVLQGFSFIFYYAQQKKWSKAIPAVIIIVSLLLPQLLLYLVRILGIIDIGFPLRERVQEKK